ncbi:MAG: hypothetical protein H7Z16_00290 [Pyrinomonadaceae bacterium]|nr:hypothetical protein [Pyrinomonadaceae bacterium]
MKRFLMAIALACALSSSTLAGDIPSVGAPSPPPPATNQITSAPLPGDIPSDGFAAQVSDAARSAFLTVLGLVVV